MPTKDEEAVELARKHYEFETGLTKIFRLKGAPEAEYRSGEPIKLLEVNENTVPSGILPLRFGPAPHVGLHHPSIIVEVTPDEFRMIQRRELALPHGWEVGELIPRPSAGDDG